MSIKNDGVVGALGIAGTRAPLREQLIKRAEEVSDDYKEKWRKGKRPRATANFGLKGVTMQVPFTVNGSLPRADQLGDVRVARWETALRGIEERLMLLFFGSLPSVTWARILAAVYEKAQNAMGDFDVQQYRQWAHNPWDGAHTVGPGGLGCPFRDSALRLLPKGACGVSPAKPPHDDDNGVVSLSCWTGLNESDTPTELVFILNGAEVILEVSPLRWVLFMGFVPHESRPVDPNHPGTTDRVHHSSFTKPLMEHIAAHVLSRLPCEAGKGDWTLDAARRLRPCALRSESLQAILSSA